eukprot:CAMPEP_0113963234 /NCGR_PEP_ID=MMETSP0011_2-20120614/6391_1 /TAXON_ID=101924 /ORGANISM="Rhodosorus marinus" /LENGTH=326 /DNA_ID=CAMNT_0000975243 /DNA_START=295 /DNA_END=1275 /DNA_ORIENTATION=- /assembly_acc=CAM_ASM_000156
MAEKIIENQSIQNSMLAETEKMRDELKVSADELQRKLVELSDYVDKYEGEVAKFKKNLKEISSSGAGETVETMKTDLIALSKLLPITGGPFVELFLGKMNVRFAMKKERLQFKSEYELFKQKLSFVFVVLSLVSLMLNMRWVHIFLQLFLSYYYVTIAIRENILRENGSNIKSWWIQHHYLMVGCGVVLMTWPPTESYHQFSLILHAFGLYVSFLQIFQTRYQMARLYTQRALGKAGEMDVVNTDTRETHWTGSVKLLLPMVWFGHMFQLHLAIYAFRIWLSFPKEIHPLCVSMFNLAMFLGNFSTTLIVVREKAKNRTANNKKTQ